MKIAFDSDLLSKIWKKFKLRKLMTKLNTVQKSLKKKRNPVLVLKISNRKAIPKIIRKMDQDLTRLTLSKVTNLQRRNSLRTLKLSKMMEMVQMMIMKRRIESTEARERFTK